MKQRVVTFLAGILIGGLLLGGVGFAGTKAAIEVYPESLRFVVNGNPVSFGETDGRFFNGETHVPTGFMYEGTTYVPVRFLTEQLGQTVDWEEVTRTVSISGSNHNVPIQDEAELPAEIREWIERSRVEEATQSRTLGDKAYLLITRGEKPTGGYTACIDSVRMVDGELVVQYSYGDPNPGDFLIQVITYPYDVAVVEASDAPIRFVRSDGAVSAKTERGR